MQVREITDGQEWDALIATHPQAHPLQTWGWGDVKHASGWGVWRVAVTDEDGTLRAAAQVLRRQIPRLPLSMIYAPRGPVIDPMDGAALEVLSGAIRQHADKVGAIFFKIDPAWPAGTEHVLARAKFAPSNEPVQVTDTYTLDLTKSEDDLLKKGMKSKTRQYINKGVTEGAEIIRDTTGEYLEACYQIYTETSRRAKFGLHPREYYDQIFRLYDPARQYLYISLREGVPLSFLWLACFGKHAVELYGGVSDAGKEYHSNYTLKWHGIKAMKAAGYTLYDLNGRVTEGIKQFKEGFGPDETLWIGPYDRVYHPVMYSAWTRALPLAKRFLAREGGEGE